MKKILSMLLSVCLVLTMIPVISFAAEDDQASGDGNVTPMESQEEIVGEENPDTQGTLEEPTPGEEVIPGNEAPEGVDENVPEEPAAENEGDGDVQVMEGEDPIPDGWHWDDVNMGWQYFKNGTPLRNGMQQIGSAGDYYYLDANGYMQTGLRTYDGKKYYFNPVGTDPSEPGKYGARKTGWINVTNVGKCYFNPEMKTGLQTINGSKYYLDPSTGAMKKGWQTVSGSKYYFSDSTGAALTGWQTIKGNKYYFSTGGIMQTGWKTISKKKYYFSPSTGRMQTGWMTLSGNKYHFTDAGVLQTGWTNINGSKYYFNPSSNPAGAMKKGWLTLSGKKYYLDKSNGKMKKGWQTISSKKYFFNTKTGVMAKGWVKNNNKRYYTDTKTGVMKTGLLKISGTYYFFKKSSGVMKTNGAEKISGKLYYFQNSGKARMAKGWFKGHDGKKRYSLGKGVVATGKKKISGTWYVFSTSNGAVTKVIGDDIDKKVQGKSSSTSKLVVVYRARYQVRIYTGSKNNWTRSKKFDCAIGKPATPTPTGTFKITKKGEKNVYTVDGVQTRYWFWCYYNGKQGIHSGLYYDGGPNDGKDYDTRVNVKSTNGGVRVSYNNARWIYNNVPVGTTVVIY